MRFPCPCGGGDRAAIGGGSLGSPIVGRAIGLSLPPPSASPTPPPQGEALWAHDFTLTRRRLRWDGKGAKRPGLARNRIVASTVSTKTSAPRSRYPEAFGSRILNPLRWRPPTGRTLACPGPCGRFQPASAASADPFTAWVSSCVARNLPRSVAKASLKTTDERFPLDHPRKPQRSPYVRPSRALRWDQDKASPEGWG